MGQFVKKTVCRLSSSTTPRSLELRPLFQIPFPLALRCHRKVLVIRNGRSPAADARRQREGYEEHHATRKCDVQAAKRVQVPCRTLAHRSLHLRGLRVGNIPTYSVDMDVQDVKMHLQLQCSFTCTASVRYYSYFCHPKFITPKMLT